jgi:hypothetical protein
MGAGALFSLSHLEKRDRRPGNYSWKRGFVSDGQRKEIFAVDSSDSQRWKVSLDWSPGQGLGQGDQHRGRENGTRVSGKAPQGFDIECGAVLADFGGGHNL